MECKDCKYIYKDTGWNDVNVCKITHKVNPISCYIENNDDIEHLHICYNCQYWLGGGDWGLSCTKNYYNCSSNGFHEACEQFERKFTT